MTLDDLECKNRGFMALKSHQTRQSFMYHCTSMRHITRTALSTVVYSSTAFQIQFQINEQTYLIRAVSLCQLRRESEFVEDYSDSVGDAVSSRRRSVGCPVYHDGRKKYSDDAASCTSHCTDPQGDQLNTYTALQRPATQTDRFSRTDVTMAQTQISNNSLDRNQATGKAFTFTANESSAFFLVFKICSTVPKKWQPTRMRFQ